MSGRLSLWLAGAFALLLLSGVASAQSSCAEVLEEAEARYMEGALDEVIMLLTGCSPQRGGAAESMLATYRLLAMAHLDAGDIPAAKLALVQLLEIGPSYEPDLAVDPTPYTVLVAEVKRDLDIPSASDQRCDEEVAEAEALYAEAAYNEAIGLLGDCLDRTDLIDDEIVRTHRLLALLYLRQGALTPARNAVRSLLMDVPEYQPNEVQDLPAYVSLVRIVKEQVDQADS